MKRKILSIITALALCLSLCPTWAFAVEGEPDTGLCDHHREHIGCGYIAPTEGHDCGHAHGDECYSEETRCAHVHDGSCYSDGLLPAEGEDRVADACAHVCSAESGCVTRTLDCQHSHDSACGYVQADPGAPCGYECRICPIEALIAALPEQVTEDNADDVRAQLDHILDLYRELNEDEQEEIDLSRVTALQEALDAANAPVAAAETITVTSNTDVTLIAEDGGCQGHTFTGTTQWTRIYVESGAHDVTFSRLNITGTAYVGIAPGATMNLTLEDSNTIKGFECGIYVPKGATLVTTAESAGSLDVSGPYSAGIGGSLYDLNSNDGDIDCGTVIINGGNITATGGSAGYASAGIGGAAGDNTNDGNGGNITINGGKVTAKGGYDGVSNAPGIGGSTSAKSDGTLTISSADVLDGNTTLGAKGTYTITGDPTADMIVVPELVYTGEVLDTSGIKIDDSKTGTGTYFGQTFTVNASADGWTYTIDPAVVKAAGDYTVTFSKEGHTSISKTFTVAQSGTQFVGDGEVKTYNGDTLTTSFSAGDTIKVVATPTPTGAAPTNSAMFAASFTAPGAGQMAVFVNDIQVSEPVNAVDGSYTMTVSAADVLLAAGGPDAEITLTAKFVENDNMADGTGTATVNITAVAVAEKDGKVIGYYGESNLDKAFANDGATVTLLDNITTSMHVGVDTGNLTLDLNGKTITKPASYGLYVSGSGHLTIRGNGKVICTGTSGHYPEAITSLGGTLTLESGTFIGIMYGVHVRGETSVLSVTGESVSIQCEGRGLYISQAQSVELSAGTYEGGAAAIKIYGGTGTLAGLLNQEGASRVAYYKDNTTLVTEGLDGKELTGGSYTVKACTHIFGSSPTCLACGEQAVARVTIGDAVTHYGDLPSTWAAVQGQTADLYLLKSVDTAGVGTWGRLDLASGSVMLGMADGVVLSGSSNQVIKMIGGELTLNSGTIRNNGTTTIPTGLQVSDGTLRVSGGTVEANWALYINGGHAEITGGTFTATGEYSVGLRKDEGTVKISGGQFSGSLYAVYNSNGTLADLLAEGYAFKQNGNWVTDTSGNSLTGTVTVAEAPVKITAQPVNTSQRYGDMDALSIETSPGQGESVTYQWYVVKASGAEAVSGEIAPVFSPSQNQRLDVGSYQYFCEVTKDGYSLRSNTVTFTVTPRQLTPAITGDATKTYDGTTDAPDGLPITLDGVVDGDDVTATATGYAYDNANAGENKTITASGITLEGNSKDNYTLSSTTATTTGTITKATVSITWGNTTQTVTYSGTQATITVPTVNAENGVAVNVTPEYSYAAQGGTTFTPGLPTNAGTYTVRASTVESGNLTAAQADMTLTINKASLSIDSATVASKPYNGNATATVEAVTFDGLKNGETLALGTDYTATGAFADANAGENKSVTVTVTLAGTDKANNYQLSGSTCAATGTITKADPVVTAVSVSTPATIYESASLDSIALTHGVGDTAGTVALNPSQTLTVGTKGYAWTFTPDDTNNYSTATGKISLTVERDTLQSIAVTTQPTKTTYTYGESFDKAGMVITATYASSATKDVTGEVQISPAELTVTTTELTITYQGKTVTQAITVGPKTVSAPTIELSPSSFVYDGAEKKPTVTVKDGTTVIPANEYTVGYSNNTNVGNATVTITNVAGNYTVSGTKTFAISAKPLTGAKVEVTGTFTYTGSAQEPTPTVTLDGKTLTANTDYTVTYADNTDVGTAKITVTGKGNYSGTAQGTFTIGRADLTVDGIGTASGTYGDKLSELTVSGLTAKLGEATVTGTWKLAGGTVPNVGDSGEYTATFTPATGADNYNALTAKVTLNIAKADYSGTTTASTSAKFSATGTYDLSALLPDGATAGTAATTSGIFEGAPAVSGKTLTYQLKAGAAVGSTGPITVPVISANYEDFNLTITVTVTDKEVPTLTVSPITITYSGEAVPDTAIKGTAKVGDTSVPGTWSFTEGQALTNVADSGTKTVKFVPTDKGTYAEATGTVVVTIGKATPTGAPKYTAISTSGKTLADAGLTTEGGTFSTTGTVAWVLAGTTEVTANTQYEWTFTPTDTANYTTLTGKITLWVQSTGGGGYVPSDPGSSSLPVTTTGQGSSTVTTTTTATPTASIQGGTATTAINTAMGNEIVKQAVANKSEEVVIAPNVTGSVTKAEVSIPASTVGQIGSQTSASLTVSTPVADVTIPNGGLGSLGSAGGTVTVTAEQMGSSVELTVTAGGRTVQNVPGGVTLTVPAANTTPGTVAVLVHGDGTREVVRKSVADNGAVTIPLGGSAKLEIVDNSGYFADVPATSWAADAVAFASSHELFNGTAPGQFSPDTPMSRGMLAVVLHNLESNPAQALTGAFADVDNSQWYAEGVAWAEAQGIIGGYGNGRFGPNDNITREQLAVMLWRYAGSPAATDRELHFADAHRASNWALEALRWATENGIINGKGGGILDPTGQATRAETAQMLKNFMESK